MAPGKLNQERTYNVMNEFKTNPCDREDRASSSRIVSTRGSPDSVELGRKRASERESYEESIKRNRGKEDENASTNGLTQPLLQMRMETNLPFLSILGLNVEGVTDAKCEEIAAIVKKVDCNVLCMCETHQRTLATDFDAVVDYDRIFTMLAENEWNLKVIPCSCKRKLYFGGHGMALFTKKSLVCTDFQPITIPSINEVDHRQFMATISTEIDESNFTTHLIFVHYKSGANVGRFGNAFKRLQFRSSIAALKNQQGDSTLIIMGDMNLDPTFSMYGEMAAEMKSLGLKMESWSQVWNKDRKNSWTRRLPVKHFDNNADEGSDGKSEDHADGENESDSDGKSEDHADGENESDSDGKSDVESDGENEDDSDGESDEESDGESDEQSDGENEDDSDGESDWKSKDDSDEESDGESDDESDGESNKKIGNMLDQVACKTQQGVVCKVDLLSPPDFQLSSDHEKFYLVRLYASSESNSLTEYTFDSEFPIYCEDCGRGYRRRAHNPCPNINENDIALVYQNAKNRKLVHTVDKEKEFMNQTEQVLECLDSFPLLFNRERRDNLKKYNLDEKENVMQCLRIYNAVRCKVKGAYHKKTQRTIPKWERDVYNWHKNHGVDHKAVYAKLTEEDKVLKRQNAREYYTKRGVSQKGNSVIERRKKLTDVRNELEKIETKKLMMLKNSYKRKRSLHPKNPNITYIEIAAATKFNRELMLQKKNNPIYLEKKASIMQKQKEIADELSKLTTAEISKLYNSYIEKKRKGNPQYGKPVTDLEKAANAKRVRDRNLRMKNNPINWEQKASMMQKQKEIAEELSKLTTAQINKLCSSYSLKKRKGTPVSDLEKAATAKYSRDMRLQKKIRSSFPNPIGQLTIKLDDPSREGAFLSCSTDPICSAQTVRTYMQRYQTDCDHNGVIDCDDMGKIHLMGPDDCANPRVPTTPFYKRFRKCFDAVLQLSAA